MIKRNSNRKLTLEQRITRLENALRGKRGTRKFESNDDLAREIDSCLRGLMGNDYWNISVVDAFPKAGCKVEIDDGEDDEYSIRGYFTVRPNGSGYIVSSVDDVGKREYDLGTAGTIDEAAELISEEINERAMDL